MNRQTDLTLDEVIEKLPLAPDGPATNTTQRPNCMLANELGIIFCQEGGGQKAEDALVQLLQGKHEDLAWVAGQYLTHISAPALSPAAQEAVAAAGI